MVFSILIVANEKLSQAIDWPISLLGEGPVVHLAAFEPKIKVNN